MGRFCRWSFTADAYLLAVARQYRCRSLRGCPFGLELALRASIYRARNSALEITWIKVMRKGPTFFYVQRHRGPRETAGRIPAEVRLHLGYQRFAQKRCGVLVDLPYERVLLGVAPLLPGIVDPVSQKPPVEDEVDVFREALDETEALHRLCQAAPGNTSSMARLGPSCASDVTQTTPSAPRTLPASGQTGRKRPHVRFFPLLLQSSSF